MGLRIETFGLPGAGKSTLTKACLPLLKKANWRVIGSAALDRLDADIKGPAPNFWYEDSKRQSHRIVEFQVQYPDLDRFFADRYRDRIRNRTLVSITGANCIKAAALKDQFDLLWVDEGFLHYGMHAICLQNGGVRDTHMLVRAMSKPDAVVMVETDPQAALDSVLRRCTAGGMPPEKAAKYVAKHFGDIAAFTHRFQMIKATCQALDAAGVVIIRQQAMGDIQAMAQDTIQQITALFPRSEQQRRCA